MSDLDELVQSPTQCKTLLDYIAEQLLLSQKGFVSTPSVQGAHSTPVVGSSGISSNVPKIKIPSLAECLRLGMKPYTSHGTSGLAARGHREGGGEPGGGWHAGCERLGTVSAPAWREQQEAIAAANALAMMEGNVGGEGVGEGPEDCREMEADVMDTNEGDYEEGSAIEFNYANWRIVQMQFKHARQIVLFLKQLTSITDPEQLRSLVSLTRALADSKSLDGIHMATSTELITLYNLAKQCHAYENHTKTLTFFSMMASLRLFVRANRLIVSEGWSNARVWCECLKKSGEPTRNFHLWIREGTILIQFAKVGGLPMLVLLALVNVRTTVRSNDDDFLLEIWEFMLNPPAGNAGDLVRLHIIPALQMINCMGLLQELDCEGLENV
ncbi:hypothetical protein PUNSTDRAFT_136691 [Punctularia strigosozonata HHB-11173 SS5]|uniref:uncharacterized protein n=1 Tax=Punctularia strigosozonata (strain HHB-11173) TaxID=741275 RepID=UPI0004417A7A|nr:uncharacterized protein PUNSTDRAFT_136691 [Punctularia strigosozonata HHB-11173 SS5]EIN06869.1 hypothetical protein PUNSTDRAFT_136691 [Punctularia strigosozonata HHB-11173 SS5]